MIFVHLCSLLYPQRLEQGLAYSVPSINSCSLKIFSPGDPWLSVPCPDHIWRCNRGLIAFLCIPAAMVTRTVGGGETAKSYPPPSGIQPTPPSITKTHNPPKPTALPLAALSAVGTTRPGPRTQKHKHPAHAVTQQRKHSRSHRPHPRTIIPRSHSLCSGKITWTRCQLARHPLHSLGDITNV